MTTSQPHQLQLLYLREWLDHSLTLDARTKVPTEVFYKQYLKDLHESTGSLGVKPKTFSKELRIHFKNALKAQKVRFGYQGAPIIEGVTFKNSDYETTSLIK